MFKGLCYVLGGSFSLTHYLAKFVCHRPRGSRDITGLIFDVTLLGQAIKGSCDFMEGGSSLYIPTLASLVAISIVVVDA